MMAASWKWPPRACPGVDHGHGMVELAQSFSVVVAARAAAHDCEPPGVGAGVGKVRVLDRVPHTGVAVQADGTEAPAH